MKSKLVMIAPLILAVVFIGYPEYLRAQPDEVDRAWQGSGNSRTWVVYSIDDGGQNFHFGVGDAFRIEKRNESTVFVPLFSLRGRWKVHQQEPDFSIALEKTAGKNKKLCGKFELTNHNKGAKEHYIVIDPPGHGPNANIMDVSIEEDLSCDDAFYKSNHGGRVHAEN